MDAFEKVVLAGFLAFIVVVTLLCWWIDGTLLGLIVGFAIAVTLAGIIAVVGALLA